MLLKHQYYIILHSIMKYAYHCLLTSIFFLILYDADAQKYSYVFSRDEDNRLYLSDDVSMTITITHTLIKPTLYEITMLKSLGWCEFVIDVPSYGMVKQFGDTVVLHDITGNYKMKAIRTDTTLRIIQGFEYLKSITLKGDGKMDYYPRFNFDSFYNMYLSHNKPVYDNDSNYLFKIGTYGHGYPEGLGLHLIFSNYSYQYRDDSLLLTKGTWQRIGNLILLDDQTLNTHFILRLNGNSKLTAESFPYTYNMNMLLLE